MPISIKKGIHNESWSFTCDEEKVRLDVKRSGHPHTLLISNQNGFNGRHPWEIFFRILNELVWYFSIRIQDINGGYSRFCANANFLPSDDGYALRLTDFQQKVFSKNKHLALGFYREGVSSGSPYYAFLCFAKILEIPFKNGRDKGEWIDNEIPNLSGDLSVSFRDRKVRLLDGKTLGMWLKEEGRDALAHSNIHGDKLVRDPNCYNDWDEIKWGNEIMRELAEKIIIEKRLIRRICGRIRAQAVRPWCETGRFLALRSF